MSIGSMKSLESSLRSLFISLFPLAAVLILGHTIVSYMENGFLWQRVGLFGIALTITIFFAGLFIKPRARTDANLKLYSYAIAIGLILNVASIIFEPLGQNNLWASLFLGTGWLLYIKWFSIFKDRENNLLEVGKQLVAFKLEHTEKQSISSRSFLGAPTIFIFYRGNWCPLCMAQIKEIATQYEALEKLGANTVLISPQPHKHTKALAEKFKLNFHFLVDSKNKVAKQLGILAANGIPAGFQVLGYDSDTAMPTVVITDKNGKIIFADLTDNYRVRPEPELFLKVIEQSLALP